MINAVFTNSDHCTVRGLWQWDYGQKLRIQGLQLPTAVEVQFSLQKTGGETESRIGVTSDGITTVPIPDKMLENEGATQDYYAYAFIYLTDETSGKTVKMIIMEVQARSKPEAFDTPEDAELFREAIAAVNESADRAESAKTDAESWAHGHEDYPERDDDNAKYYADQAKNTAKEIEDAKSELDSAISEGKQVAGDARTESEVLSGKIKDSQNAVNEVAAAVKQASEANMTLSGTIQSAGESKTQAEETKKQLDSSTSTAEEMKTALDNAVDEVAKDATVENVADLIQKSIEFLEIIAESAGKAGSLNGFGLNMGVDGAVILSYSDPETGELIGSATFPRETTLQEIGDCLDGINENLKVIAIKGGI